MKRLAVESVDRSNPLGRPLMALITNIAIRAARHGILLAVALLIGLIATPARAQGVDETELAILTEYLPQGEVDLAYQTGLEADGVKGSAEWSLRSGSLPGGLSIDRETGSLSGTPLEAGRFEVEVEVRDAIQKQAWRKLVVTVFPRPGKWRPPVPPQWVFEPWVWEDDDNTEQVARELIDGYLSRDIPVGAIILDSPWETNYNTFEFSGELYPGARRMIDDFHRLGVKVLCWITSLINISSKDGPDQGMALNYEHAKNRGYFLNDAETYRWWKGRGSFIDFTNPDAAGWWSMLMDKAFDVGIDGWKTDAGNRLVPEVSRGYAGEIRRSEYGRMYYRHFYQYTLMRGGPQSTIITKTFDENPADSMYVPVPYAPVCWMGDQLQTWDRNGLLGALRNLFLNSEWGYAIGGPDIGGYSGEGIDRELFVRWAQLGALCPVMENGGRNDHRPWSFGEEVVDIYRYFAQLHHQLVPYFYHYAVVAHETGSPVIRPTSGKWQYMLGDDIFVSAIYKEVVDRDVTLPDGDNWHDYWDDGTVYDGGKKLSDYPVPLDRYPIFIRQGAIIPMFVDRALTGHGTEASQGFLTVVVYPGESRSLELRREDRAPLYVRTEKAGNRLNLTLGPTDMPVIFRVKSAGAPPSVDHNLSHLAAYDNFIQWEHAATGWYFDGIADQLWIKLPARSASTLLSFAVIGSTTDVQDPGDRANSPTPGEFALSAGYPNPYPGERGEQGIRYELALPAPAPVDVSIYDLRGRLVRTIRADTLSGGHHRLRWDGKLNSGEDAPTGLYIVLARWLNRTVVQKALILR